MSQCDLNCSVSENGVDALKLVQKNLDLMNEETQYDMLKHIHLIILDWNMPLMKGDEACRKIRLLYENYNNSKNMDEKLKHVPVNKRLSTMEKIRDEESNQDQHSNIEDKIVQLKQELSQVKSILQAESVIDRMPLIICNSAFLNASEEQTAKEVGFDMIVSGTMT